MKFKRTLGWFVLIIILIVSINFVFYPAYLSYSSTCLQKDIEGYETGATTTYTPADKETEEKEGKNITIDFQFTPDKKIIKHEIVHVTQIENERVYSCNYLLGVPRYFNEAEAYFSSYLPDNLFSRIYPVYDRVF